MKKLYKSIKPYRKGFLKVSGLHSLYFEESGNPKGKPIIHFHGGPGSRSKPKYRRYFNPRKYRIIMFDQRGCGKSKPMGELKENTTKYLISDIEKLRKYLKIDSWIVSGGSWGSTLALAYAQSYPKKVKALILRGIFTFTKREIDWLINEKATYFYPDVWEEYIKSIPRKERKNILLAFYKRINSKNKSIQAKAIQAFNFWDGFRMDLNPKISSPNAIEINEKNISATQIFFHYLKNNGFLKEKQLIKNIGKIRNIPSVIIHGRYDMVCPLITAWELHKAWPEAEFHIIPIVGHRLSTGKMTDRLIECTDTRSRG